MAILLKGVCKNCHKPFGYINTSYNKNRQHCTPKCKYAYNEKLTKRKIAIREKFEELRNGKRL